MLLLLLEKGADPYATDSVDYDCLLIAAQKGNVNIVKILLGQTKPEGLTISFAYDVNRLQKSCSMTALMWAARTNSLEVAKSLIEAGADINLQ